MMNDLFSGGYLNQQPSRPAWSVPVQQTQRRSSPKVVSVPVHFVSSEQPRTTMSMLKESAALRIQRVLRGFLVRKSVKKIASIRNEVSEIERRMDNKEVVDLVRTDAKERLRVNETLMSLLFKLDSIRGVDCGVRDLRKAVTKKAVALQEKVDSIAQADHQTLAPGNDDSGQTDSDIVSTRAPEQVTEASSCRDKVVDHSNSLEAVEEDGESSPVKEAVEEILENCNPDIDAVDGRRVEENMEASPTWDLTGVAKTDNSSVNGSMEADKDEKSDGRDDKRSRELMEKLVDDNEKMMKLMMQIFERNETQTEMLNSLGRRVEQLEKTLMCEKLRRKKKRHAA